jgi:hypothetical protein
MKNLWNGLLELLGIRKSRTQKVYVITSSGKFPLTWLRARYETHIHTIPEEYFPDYNKKYRREKRKQ